MTSQSPTLLRHYPGGKGCVGVYQKLINCMPPHEVYVEAFLGAGSILRHKRPADRSVGIDLDETVIRSWSTSKLPSLEMVHGDALEILKTWPWSRDDSQKTLIYCDPPYLKTTRSTNRRLYRCDLPSLSEHTSLLEILNSLPCMVMLSGYGSQLYSSMLPHWRREDFRTRNRAGSSSIESIWMNFPPPLRLHDYSYLGQGFRERERIKRKRDRWKAKLQNMPALEREALISVLNDVDDVEGSTINYDRLETNNHHKR